jgi:hypothetical protein
MNLDPSGFEIEQLESSSLWSEHTSFSDETAPITALEYDNCYDMLWVATATGRLTSYSLSDNEVFLEDMVEENGFLPSPPHFTRYSSFAAVKDPIVQVVPNQSTLVAVGCSSIRLQSVGGAPLGCWKLNSCPNSTKRNEITMMSNLEHSFTCADLVRDPMASRFSSAYLASSLLAGTSSTNAFLFDLTQSIDSPVLAYNVASPSVKIFNNGEVTVVAGQDGTTSGPLISELYLFLF